MWSDCIARKDASTIFSNSRPRNPVKAYPTELLNRTSAQSRIAQDNGLKIANGLGMS